MAGWHVRVGIQLPGMNEDHLVATVDADNEVSGLHHDGALGRLTCNVDIQADDPAAAAALGIGTVAKALAAVGHTPPPAVYVEVMSDDWLTDTVDLAPLGILGIGDIARIHGCSRQRAAKLTELPGFPAPIETVGARRLYDRSDVERFLAGYDPKPGRPATSTR
jgi:hypothetical protein